MNQEGIRCGFFNSVNNDRKYNAEDMGRLFEGVISDGVFSTIEPKFKVEAVPETMNLLVNNGKAWFHERYFEIYDPVTVSIRPTDINPRIDAVCICINTNDSVRAGSIKVVEGNTNKPSMPAEDGVYYIPIAWVTVGPNDTVSTDLDIESNVGNSTDEELSYRCPYSEPSLDPRRAVYAYEGETHIDPTINKMVVLSATTQDSNYTDESVPITGSGYWLFDYPEGFTFDNTLILSLMLEGSAKNYQGSWWETIGVYAAYSSGEVYTYTDYVQLLDSTHGNKIKVHQYGTVRYATYGCKVIIMKLEDQNE